MKNSQMNKNFKLYHLKKYTYLQILYIKYYKSLLSYLRQ